MDKLKAAIAAAVGAGGVFVAAVGLLPQSEPSDLADPSMQTTAAEMQKAAEEYAVPLLLPVSLPRDYGWAGFGETDGDGRQVYARTVQFTSVDGRPLVELCAAGPDQKDACLTDSDPYVVRRVDGLRVVISFERSAPVQADSKLREFWSDVNLTDNYEKVSWLAR